MIVTLMPQFKVTKSTKPDNGLRKTLSPTYASMFVDIFQELFKNPRNVLVPYSKVTHMSPDTLHHRISEAIKYLCLVNCLGPNPPLKGVTLTTDQFLVLRAKIKFRKTQTGILIDFRNYVAQPNNTKARLAISDCIKDSSSDLNNALASLDELRLQKEKLDPIKDKALIESIEDKEITLMGQLDNTAVELERIESENSNIVTNDKLFDEIVAFIKDEKATDFIRNGLAEIGGVWITGDRYVQIMDLIISAGNIQHHVDKSTVTLVKI